MKKLALLVLILSVSIIGTAQYSIKSKNAVYLSYQPFDHGLGIRGDYHFWISGMYGSLSYGNFNMYRQANLRNHIKGTLGFLVPVWDSNWNQFDVSAGVNYHHVDKFGPTPIEFREDGVIYDNWSFEIGLSVKLKRFAIGVRTDILRWEPCIDVGLVFGKKKNRRPINGACR